MNAAGKPSFKNDFCASIGSIRPRWNRIDKHSLLILAYLRQAAF